ncbi:NAD(P)H-dependent flavin oxidoreductase [Azospirillum endophyticum]
MIPESLIGRLKVPAMAAPMFLVSGPDLVVETCKGGILGTFPTLNQRTPESYEAWLVDIRKRLSGTDAAPFGVQMGIHRTNPRMAADLELSIRHQVPLLVTTLGITREITDAVHAYGGLVFHDATTVKHAVKALEANVDGVIAVCAGAGGHSGTYNPFAFLGELRPLVGDKTLILAGSIGNGQAVAGAIAAGADMVSIGTRFIATPEGMCSDAQKLMILESTVQDVVYTDEVSGIGASILRQTLSRPYDAPAQIGRFDVGKEISPKLWKNIWSAGQGVGAVNDVLPAAELCRRLRDEYRAALERVSVLAAA